MHSISLIQENQTALKQQQQLLMNLAMRQAFHVLQLPTLELSEWLNSEIESNPVLEIDLTHEEFKGPIDEPRERAPLRNKSQENWERKRKEHQDNLLKAHVSLYEHLKSQAVVTFEERGDLHLAKLIIGHLNEKGFLETSLEEIAPSIPLEKMQRVLKHIQSLDPPGIGARNLQECLLLQLQLKNKENSPAAQIIANHFDDLVHNRLPLIAQKLSLPIDVLAQIIDKEIAPLDLNPGYRFSAPVIASIIPDLLLLNIEGTWQIEVNTSFLPKFQIAPVYMQALQERSLENAETSYLRRQVASGRWLRRIVHKRNTTLHRIGTYLLKRHLAFFNGDSGSLTPLTMKEAADELGIHESTVARAVAHKFIAAPQGMFALKSFFQQGVETKSGEKISNRSLRAMLTKFIDEEDKSTPLSDEQLARRFQKMGIPCARRTIAKYRSSLKIAPACQRKRWSRSK